MGAWLKDLTHAWRRFSKSPGFVAAVVISIGLGIAANSTIFSMLSRFVLRPALVGDPTTLLSLHTTEPFWLICAAWLGINTAPFSVLRTSFTSTNWPGQKLRSGLPIVARRLTVPLPACRPPSAFEPQADHEQKLAFFQVLAILEMALDNPATHLRCHCDRFERGIPADFVEIFRNILRGRLHHRDQWWRRGRSAACTSLRLHAAVINSAAAANTGSPARENGLLVNVLVILILQNVVVLCRSAERRKYLK
jgi:hypothetical protein